MGLNSIITLEAEGGAALGVPGQPGQHTEPQGSQGSIETPSKQKQTKKQGGTAVRKTQTAHFRSPVGSAFEIRDAAMTNPQRQIGT